MIFLCALCLVTQSCPILCDPMDYTVHGILQARILEQVAFPFSRGSSQPEDWALQPRDWGFPYSSISKESVYNAGDPGSTPGLGRSPGGGNSNPLQYSCLENPTDRGAWQATVHGVIRVRHTLWLNHHHPGIELFLASPPLQVGSPGCCTEL